MALWGPSWRLLGRSWARSGPQKSSKSGPKIVEKIVHKCIQKLIAKAHFLGQLFSQNEVKKPRGEIWQLLPVCFFAMNFEHFLFGSQKSLQKTTQDRPRPPPGCSWLPTRPKTLSETEFKNHCKKHCRIVPGRS